VGLIWWVGSRSKKEIPAGDRTRSFCSG